MRLDVREFTTQREFDQNKSRWADLFEKLSRPSPFLSPGWFEACLSFYLPSSSIHLALVLVEKGSELVGVFPLCREKTSFRHIEVSSIQLIQGPDSPFVDFLIRPELEEACIRAFLNFLLTNRRTDWDVAILNKLPNDSRRTNLFLKILRERKIKFSFKTTGAMPNIRLQGTWKEFFQSKTTRFRKTKRNIVNKMKKLDDVVVECIRADPKGIAIKEFFAIGEKGWKFQEGKSVSNSQEAQNFFEILTANSTQYECFMLWFLRCGKRPIAAEYDLVSSGVVYALRSEFDQAFHSYSPGAFLEMEILQSLFEGEFIEYNSGQGLNDYKLRWTENCHETVTVEIFNSNLRGQMAGILENVIVPKAKWVRGKLQEKLNP